MWMGYPRALAEYYNLCLEVWERRGYRNDKLKPLSPADSPDIPWWLGKEEFHASHRQTLLWKNVRWYSQFGWEEAPKYEYWWPTKQRSLGL
jgi:hypothetical protein